MAPITVYSKPQCGQCILVKHRLKRAGIPFDEVDISKDESAREYVINQGFLAAPVVSSGGSIFGGSDTDALNRLIADHSVS